MATTREPLHELLDTVPDDRLDDMGQALAALAALAREPGPAAHFFAEYSRAGKPPRG